MIALQLALAFVAGIALAAVEQLLVVRLGVAPDLAAVALALLLTTPARPSTGVQAIGLLLGFSTSSLDPLGAWILGGGIAAAILLPLRELVFLESVGTQLVFGLLCSGALLAARTVYVLFEGGVPLPFTPHDLVAPLLAAAAVPILHRSGTGALRNWRRLRERWEAREEGGGEAPPAT
jgi:hypothetical protein